MEMSPRAIELITGAFGVTIVIAHTIPSLMCHYASPSASRFGWSNLAKRLNVLRRELLACYVNHTDPLEKRVTEEMQEKQFRNRMVWMFPIIYLTCVFELSRLYSISMQRERWMTPAHDVLISFGYVLMTMYRFSSDRFKRCHGDLLIMHIYCLPPVFLWTSGKGVTHLVLLEYGMLPIRMFLFCSCSGPVAQIFCNGLYCTVALMVYVPLASQSFAVYGMACTNVFQLVLTFVYAPMFIVMRRKEATRFVETSVKQNELGAARALLGTICDAVVELNDDYALTEDCLRLHSTLLSAKRESNKGAFFLQFLSSAEDRDYFIANVTRTTPNVTSDSEQAFAHTFHVTLKDSFGIPFRTQLFHVPFEACGKRHHLIGVSEMSLYNHHGAEETAGAQNVLTTHLDDIQEGPKERCFPRHLDNAADEGLQTQTGSQTPSLAGSSVPADQLTARVCLNSEEITISDCDNVFCNILGLKKGDHIADVVSLTQRDAFENWIREAANRSYNWDVIADFCATLSPPRLKRFGIVGSVRVAVNSVALETDGSHDVHGADAEDDQPSDDDFLARGLPLIFYDLHFGRRKVEVGATVRVFGVKTYSDRIGTSRRIDQRSGSWYVEFDNGEVQKFKPANLQVIEKGTAQLLWSLSL